MNPHFIMAMPGAGVESSGIVMNRQEVAGRLKDFFASGHSPKSHLFKKRNYHFTGTFCFVRTNVVDEWGDGKKRNAREWRVLYKNGKRWTLLMALPLFFETRVVVKQVSPGTQAGGLYLKPGDILLSYNGENVYFKEEMYRIVNRCGAMSPRKQLPLRYEKAGAVWTALVAPGKLGLIPETRILPDDTANYIRVEDINPLKNVVYDIKKDLKNRNIRGILEKSHTGNYLYIGRKNNGIIFADKSGGFSAMKVLVNAAAKIVDLKSYKCREVRAISFNGLALVSARIQVKLSGGKSINTVGIYLYAREGKEWRFVMDIPLFGVDIGLDPPIGEKN